MPVMTPNAYEQIRRRLVAWNRRSFAASLRGRSLQNSGKAQTIVELGALGWGRFQLEHDQGGDADAAADSGYASANGAYREKGIDADPSP